eukprot:3166703-Rhodomonas_salina.1
MLMLMRRAREDAQGSESAKRRAESRLVWGVDVQVMRCSKRARRVRVCVYACVVGARTLDGDFGRDWHLHGHHDHALRSRRRRRRRSIEGLRLRHWRPFQHVLAASASQKRRSCCERGGKELTCVDTGRICCTCCSTTYALAAPCAASVPEQSQGAVAGCYPLCRQDP